MKLVQEEESGRDTFLIKSGQKYLPEMVEVNWLGNNVYEVRLKGKTPYVSHYHKNDQRNALIRDSVPIESEKNVSSYPINIITQLI